MPPRFRRRSGRAGVLPGGAPARPAQTATATTVTKQSAPVSAALAGAVRPAVIGAGVVGAGLAGGGFVSALAEHRLALAAVTQAEAARAEASKPTPFGFETAEGDPALAFLDSSGRITAFGARPSHVGDERAAETATTQGTIRTAGFAVAGLLVVGGLVYLATRPGALAKVRGVFGGR